MSAEARYYYVDAQNQAAGPIALAGLLALKTSGTLTDATLVVVEGGTEWVAFSTLKPADGPASQPATAPAGVAQSNAEALRSPAPAGTQSAGGSSTSSEPTWASNLSQKIDQLTVAMDKLVIALEKTRSASAAPVSAPATASLHAEKINLNPTPKPGIATLNQATLAPSSGAVPRPTPLPAGISVTAPKPATAPVAGPRPGVGTTLSPLAVPANAQKSALPLPALGKAPGPAPTPAAAPAKGNIFSKFLKK